jgi:hypothetical protein
MRLSVRVDLVVVAGRVGLGRAETLGEADEGDADRARGEVQVVRGGRLGDADRRQAAVDRADDVDAVRAGQLDDHDPDRHRHQRPRDDGREPSQPQHERE